MEKVKLTTLTTKGGCGCKIGPSDLREVLHQLPKQTHDPNLLVGLDTGDDAGVYQLTDDLAIVQTVDFFTPIVDDPYDFGRIAAANAMSDVYAMGGEPITALNIVAFPIFSLDKAILTEILRGASDKLKEAGCHLVGGHSIDDQEPKFGLAVTGTIHPARVKTNAGAKHGDKLILTKPIGVGISTTSLKNNQLTEPEITRVTEVMATLNKEAAEVMNNYNVHACTDVTGFGLLGHLTEMATESHQAITVKQADVPVLPRVRELAENGNIPGGSKNNLKHVKSSVHFDARFDEIDQLILADAVTSGGLLMSVHERDALSILESLKLKGMDARIIGDVTDGTPGHIYVQG
ncbi:selenide, water dikinase [Halolactibacillus miurensis]|uniref:Selenide, water dikinase n=1 Tax=Halolactibacillus miurensis TaxID=306541 RepID=A0A1I6P6L0_9BACI|nr:MULTISPECIES: selenide, water dikinase SelD [Halolactibacillus]GEM03087.1 selenide, water dikinase [Halolactibacillus miurensis]SFS35816.1 selenide, water dikinase [Halolactibacillus miurensis]